MRGVVPILSDPGFDTERLQARPLDEQDEALFCDLYTDAGTMRHIAAPMSAGRAAGRFRSVLTSMRASAPERVFLALHARSRGDSLGLCGIARFDAPRERAEIGIILKPCARGQGLAREALSGLVSSTFARHAIREVWVAYAPANTPFERLAIGLGFSPCEDHAAFEAHTGKHARSIDRCDWNSRQTANQRGTDHVEGIEHSGSAGARRRAAWSG